MDALDDAFVSSKEASSHSQSDAYSSFTTRNGFESPPRQQTAGITDLFPPRTHIPKPSSKAETDVPSDLVLGRFSFAPATQTTVVTTTTTTTTNFPPLMMKAPKHLYDLDPKLYPLAASPTPPSMKSFSFDVDGKRTIFHEANDPDETFHEFQRQQKQLEDSNGVVRSVSHYGSGQSASQHVGGSLAASPLAGKESTRSLSASEPFHTPRSPVFGSGAGRTRNSQNVGGQQRRVPSRQISSSQAEMSRPGKSSSRLQIMQTSTPVTPSIHTRSSVERERRNASQASLNTDILSQDTNACAQPHGREVAQTLSPQPESSMNEPGQIEGSFASANSDIIMPDSIVATPPTEELVSENRPRINIPSLRPRPPALDTTAAQDASLPSPSLSPVTAAANLQSRRGYFDDSQSLARRVSDLDDGGDFSGARGLGLWSGAPSASQDQMLAARDAAAMDYPTMMDIPNMLDSFEAMPTEMKSYVMYQFLRRCPKEVLHFVADNVNPALKCDFLNLLPLELCQVVIGHLDLKSLCRAAQVSRKWRQIIDSDEKTWKNLFDREGFELAPGELRRSIMEGWGWQHHSTQLDYEQDLGNLTGDTERFPSPVPKLEPMLSTPATSEIAPEPASQGRRPKRKAAPKSRIASRKVQKKRESSSAEPAAFDLSALNKHLLATEGPYAAAQAAMMAIPSTELGLPSLRQMTLYKSVYRRHHLISSNWMQDEIKPRHLAFKAHSRHVVTCLQFDSDKILTGSDDTNINVYDTKTGALRARLQGHEGGVWALKYEGNVLVSGSTDRSVRVWDIEKGVCMHVFHGHTSTVRCLIILMPTVIGKASDGRPITMPKEPIVITGSRDSTLRIWKLPNFDEPAPRQGGGDETESPYFIRALIGHIHSVRAIAAHGDTLVSGSYDCSVRVWKISTGETVHRLTGHNQKVYSVVLDHERNRCISGSMDNLVKVWSLDSGNVLYNLEGHTSLVGLLDLQRDRLVSAAADSTLRIWDPSNGQCKNILSAHTGAITCFQHDGRKVISGSDRSLKMWNIQTGDLVRDLLTDLSGVWQVQFDGRRCVAAVQRENLTYIEILDFGASRDGLAASKRGKRIVVDAQGEETTNEREAVNEELGAEE